MSEKIIVCIDDDAGVLEAYTVLFGDQCRVLVTLSPSQGLALVRQHRPDLVITDLLMPDMPGEDLVVRIRQIHPQARIIVVSASPPKEEQASFRRLRELGVDWVFPKPFDILRFLVVISNLLGVPLVEKIRPATPSRSQVPGTQSTSGPAAAPGSRA